MPAGTIALILNLVFVLTLVIGFLIGMWRGVKKASINIVFSLAGLIIAFFVCGVVTNAILGINVQGGKSLGQLIIDAVQQDATVSQILGANANNTVFIEKLVCSLANVVVFLLLAMVIQFVCYIIYAILAAIVVKKKDKDGNKLPKHRVSGGIIGVVKTFVVMMFIFMPFNALLGTATDIAQLTYDNSTSAVEGEETSTPQSQATKVVYNVLDGLNTSAYGVVGNMFGLDNAMCDYLTVFKLDEETIYVRQDLANIASVFNAFSQINQPNTELSNLNFEAMDKAVDSIVKSGLYKKVLIDTVGNIVENYTSYTFIDWNSLGEAQNVIKDISDALKTWGGDYNDYFTNDLLKVYEAFKTVAKTGVLDNSTQLSVLDRVNKLATENYESLENAVKALFKMNIVRDGTSTALNLALSNVINGVDKVAVNGRTFDDNEWDEMAVQVSGVIKNYASVSTEVEVTTLLSQPLSLLSKESTVNITSTFDKLGKIIDGVREIKILKNQEGVCVLEGMLTDNGFKLPAEDETIYNNDGTVATIQNYTQLMNFIAPSLEELRAINVYESLSTEPVSVKDVMKTFATAVKNDKSADKDVLARIILPLSQVEPTKTMIVEEMLSGLSNDLINFGALSGYNSWKTDLNYISDLLLALDKGTIGENQTYLDYILSSNTLENLFKNMSATDAREALRPVLYAASTSSLRGQFFTSLTDAFRTLLDDNTITLNSDVTLNEANTNNQGEEICNVFEKLMAFYPTLTSETELSTLNKADLGKLLDAMKINAYREGERGIFAEVFTKLADATALVYNIEKDEDGTYKSVKFEQALTSATEN